jgi:hypothetical protein
VSADEQINVFVALFNRLADLGVARVGGQDVLFVAAQRMPVEFAQRAGVDDCEDPFAIGDRLIHAGGDSFRLFARFGLDPCSAIWYASKIVPEEPLHAAGEADVFGDALSINTKVRFGQPKMVSIQRVC